MSEVIMEGTSNDPTENLKKKPRKGILKTSSSFESKEPPSASTSRHKDCKSKRSKETKWDEMNILETLHPANKDYGHMKIDEPKTPYEKSIPDETDSVDPDVLAQRIRNEAQKPLKALQDTDSATDEESLEEKERRKQFESKRKAHYNEFLMAKAIQELMEEDDDDEEEEDGENSGAKSKK